MKIKRFNESEQRNISNERVTEMIAELKTTKSYLVDKNKLMGEYLNELNNYKSSNKKGNDQIDDSIFSFQIIRKYLTESISQLNDIIDNLDDYNEKGRVTD
jgi:hypothetical protein